jgi:kexin
MNPFYSIVKIIEGKNHMGFKTISLLLVFLFFIDCQKKEKEGITGNVLGDLFLLQTLTRPRPTTTACESTTGSDPLFSNQWHLVNSGSISGSVSGEDAKVSSVWSSGNYGQGVTIAVVDDGVDVKHEDLSANISSSVSGYNSRTGGTDASHGFSNSGHGTNVAGIISARHNNGIGLRGAAPCGSVTGRNILEASVTASVETTAMTQDADKIQVSNNSWGATDSTGTLQASRTTWQQAIDSGLTTGRSGRGTIYMWAAGNGSYAFSSPFLPPAITPALTGITLPSSSYNAEIDNSNYDGQANYYGVMAVCGVGINGVKARYSEEGANLWVCAHTQGNSTTAFTTAISTTDPSGTSGYNTGSSSTNFSSNNYNNTFNGTSAAAPLASGVVALLLQAYPNLGWRDVREILARSARQNDATDSDWVTNGAGIKINHKYGFGTVDANAAINFAKTWTPLTGSQIVASNTAWQTNGGTAVAITDNNTTPTTQNIVVSGSGISTIEWVTLEFTSSHTYSGDLTIVLTSPAGTNSILSKKHTCYSSFPTQTSCPFSNLASSTWRFGSARHLGESANGTWVVRVWDTSTGDSGNFVARISFRGR